MKKMYNNPKTEEIRFVSPSVLVNVSTSGPIQGIGDPIPDQTPQPV